MKRSTQTLVTAGLFLLALGFGQAEVAAQPFRTNPYINYAQMMQQQYIFNTQLQAYNQAYYGTPYPALYSPNYYYSTPYYPAYNQAYYPPVGVNPYLATPYVPTAPGYGVGSNPYAAVDPTLANPYNPYNSYGAGSVLSGSADYMRAYGQTVNTIEQARITRELAIQAKLDTKKKRFDLEGYIKANTPSYTEEQEKNAKLTLRRIQTNSLPGEVANGKSLNYLLNDLRKFPSKRASLEPIILTEDTLAYLNATKTVYAIGLLRDPAGRVVIPSGLDDVVKVGARQALEKQLQTLVKEAYANRIDQNLLKDVQAEIDRIRDELVKKVNDIPTPQYLEAKRFLQELSEGTRAIRLGEAMSQAKFQRWVDEGKGSRSVQELADFMIKEGFNFGPATALDEGPYRTVHAAMAAYDIAMNAQFGPEAQ